jgi:hypothetical protein
MAAAPQAKARMRRVLEIVSMLVSFPGVHAPDCARAAPLPKRHRGMPPVAGEVLRECARLGLLVDLAHCTYARVLKQAMKA